GAGSIASAGLGPAIAGIAGLGSIAMQASGAVFLLPAAVGAAAVGVGTLTLAFAGFGEAMKNLGDPAKFAEAIKDLAPAAQETAIAVRDLKPAFDALKLDVQQQFFEGLGTTVREVGGTYLPILRDGLRQVAAAMGAAAQKAGQALMRPDTIAAYRTALDNFAAAFRELIPAGGAVVRAFAQIGAVGSQFLPGLAAG